MVTSTKTNKLSLYAGKGKNYFKCTNFFTLVFLLITVTFSSSLFAQVAPVNNPTGGFHIDGGLKANTPTAGVGDWFPGSGGAGGSVFNTSVTPFVAYDPDRSGKAVDPYTSNDNIFTNGSKFNDYVGALRWFTNSAPDKNDINNALYHVARDLSNNNQWVFISGDRLSTNGTSYIDFELLQGTIVKNGDGTFTGTPLYPSDPNKSGGGRTLNDMIISMEYTNGGSKPNVYIYQWKKSGSTWSYQQVPSSSALLANAFAETNRTGAETGVPYSAFGSNTYQQYAFVEAGVNITYLLNLSGAACAGLNIQTMWVKTKASASSTAALKDFMDPIPVNFQFGNTAIDAAGPYCASDNTAYTLTATPAGGTFSGTGVSNNKFTPSVAGAGTHTISYVSSDGTCSTSTTITVYPAATANAGGTYYMCSTDASVQLVGTYGGGATGGSWSGGGGTFGTPSVNTSNKTVTITYTPTPAEKTAGSVQLTFTTTGQTSPCTAASQNATVTINPAATANAGGPYTMCSSDESVQVIGTYGGGATGGTWSGGAGTFGTPVNDATAKTITTTYTPTPSEKTAGVAIQLTFTANDPDATGPCASVANNASLTINPAATANAGGPYDMCSSDANVTLVGTYGGGATGGSWSGGGGTFGTPSVNTVNKTVTVSYTPSAGEKTAGTVQLTFTTTGQTAPCTATSQDATVTIYAAPAAPAVTYVAPACDETTFKVRVKAVEGSTFTLSQKSGGVSPITKGWDDRNANDSIVFSGLTVGMGYHVIQTTGDGCVSEANECGINGASLQQASENLITKASNESEPVYSAKAKIESPTKVLAAPNPYTEKVRFTLESAVSGKGSLELYNMMGQKVHTVFQGYVEAGKTQVVEYSVPGASRANLIYVFRVGEQRVTGKLITLK